MSAIDEVKQKTDIIEIISQQVTLTKAGRTFRGLCPFHSEKHPSFYVYPEQQSWHCFGCNNGGDVFSFIMKKQNMDFGEALKHLAQRAGVVIPERFEPGAESEEKQKLYQINQAAALYFQSLLNSPAGKEAQGYLRERGFSAKTITDFQLGFSANSWEGLKKHLLDKGYIQSQLSAAGLIIEKEDGKSHDRFRNKLMFPISDSQGRIIGFGARVLDDSLPKYVNSPQTPVFDKSGSLYGINLAKDAIREQDLAVIVEGYMDVITAHQNGFSNMVASMGTSVTEKQVGTLKRTTKNITLALDADAAGEEAMLRGVGFENSLGAEVKVVILPQGKDPDDVIKQDAQAWPKLLDEAMPVVDFTFDMVTSGLDLTTARGKASARDKLLPIIDQIKDIVRKSHYLQKLGRLIEVSERNLETDLARIRARRTRFQTAKPEPEAAPLNPLLANPVEEYCLALLLQHPELKGSDEGLLPEYFENSENREIFIAWRQSAKIESLKEALDPATHEHLDALLAKKLGGTKIGPKYTECALRLRERYLRSLAKKMEAVLALEAESGGEADLAKFKEEWIGVTTQLGEVFAQQSRRRQRG